MLTRRLEDYKKHVDTISQRYFHTYRHLFFNGSYDLEDLRQEAWIMVNKIFSKYIETWNGEKEERYFQRVPFHR